PPGLAATDQRLLAKARADARRTGGTSGERPPRTDRAGRHPCRRVLAGLAAGVGRRRLLAKRVLSGRPSSCHDIWNVMIFGAILLATILPPIRIGNFRPDEGVLCGEARGDD